MAARVATSKLISPVRGDFTFGSRQVKLPRLGTVERFEPQHGLRSFAKNINVFPSVVALMESKCRVLPPNPPRFKEREVGKPSEQISLPPRSSLDQRLHEEYENDDDGKGILADTIWKFIKKSYKATHIKPPVDDLVAITCDHLRNQKFVQASEIYLWVAEKLGIMPDEFSRMVLLNRARNSLYDNLIQKRKRIAEEDQRMEKDFQDHSAYLASTPWGSQLKHNQQLLRNLYKLQPFLPAIPEFKKKDAVSPRETRKESTLESLLDFYSQFQQSPESEHRNGSSTESV